MKIKRKFETKNFSLKRKDRLKKRPTQRPKIGFKKVDRLGINFLIAGRLDPPKIVIPAKKLEIHSKNFHSENFWKFSKPG